MSNAHFSFKMLRNQSADAIGVDRPARSLPINI